MTLLMLGTFSHAGFDWGADCSTGNGSFQQYIPYRKSVTVGDIPTNKADVVIELDATEDVDVQLVDMQSGVEIIAWPNGLLNGPDSECVNHEGVRYCYSGYNGDQTANGKGREFIRVEGTTNRPLQMRAYGYVAGDADVSYSWAASNTCNEVGEGSFDQPIAWQSTVDVGTIPQGKTNIIIELDAANGRDIDVQLWDGNTPIVQWPNGILAGATEEDTSYKGMTVIYSGYNGLDGNWGRERIEIRGATTRELQVKAFGYQNGSAAVDYRWGDGVGKMCGGIAGFQCQEGLMCKEMDPFIVDAAGTCHTETWCGSVDAAPKDCANLPHIMVPGYWTCSEQFTCAYEVGAPSCDLTGKTYVGNSQAQCAVLRFTCPEDEFYFADACGCGCK